MNSIDNYILGLIDSLKYNIQEQRDNIHLYLPFFTYFYVHVYYKHVFLLIPLGVKCLWIYLFYWNLKNLSVKYSDKEKI